jgi:hypothetical protein
MIYIEKIIRWWGNRKRKKAFRVTRETMSLFGCDLSHLSDEEIEERLFDACKIIQKAGITAEEACNGFQLASRVGLKPYE